MPKLGALAIAKAHPLIFGAVVAVAIGIVVYQLVKSKKQKKLRYSRSSGGPDDDDGDDGSPRQSEIYYYDPETKSVTNAAPRPKTSDNNLRKRTVAPNSSSDTNKNHSEAEKQDTQRTEEERQDTKNTEAERQDTQKTEGERQDTQKTEAISQEALPQKEKSVSKEVQTDSIDNNQNIDNTKVLPNKNIDSVMSVNEKVERYIHENISDAESIDSNDESDSTNNISKGKKCSNCESYSSDSDDESESSNSYVKPVKNCSCNCECHSIDINDESHSTDSIVKPIKKCCNSESGENCSSSTSCSDLASLSWSDISINDVNNMNQAETSRAPSIASIDSESSSFTILSGDSDVCRGCEQNPVNTHTLPCNHRYMCSDCAPRIFRLFKKCKVCRARIESIVVEE